MTAKSLRRLVNKMTEDPTCMTKEEYFAMLDRAEKGPRHRMLPDETLDEMLTRLGYRIYENEVYIDVLAAYGHYEDK